MYFATVNYSSPSIPYILTHLACIFICKSAWLCPLVLHEACPLPHTPHPASWFASPPPCLPYFSSLLSLYIIFLISFVILYKLILLILILNKKLIK